MDKIKPNLIFIFADQMRGQDMGCAGNPDVKTPNLDMVASRGTIFTNAISNCPVCTPARGSMLTGLHFKHIAIGNDLPVSTKVKSIAHILKERDYRTGYIGKWHLDGVPRARFTPPGERRLGFDCWAVCNCIHDYMNAYYYIDDDKPVKINGYEPVAQTDLAIKFIKRNKEKPFVLYVSYGPPHNPYELVPAEYLGTYESSKLKLRPNFTIPAGKKYGGRTVDENFARQELAGYYAHITALDFQTGRILQILDELGLKKDTIFVFTSDHGDMHYSHGYTRKQQPYEESILIPLIVRWPGVIPSDRKSDILISIVDFVPTLLGLMGMQVPDGIEGFDLSGAMLGKNCREQKNVFIYSMLNFDEARAQGIPSWIGVRTKEYTYSRTIEGGWLLYNNLEDPFQLNNLCQKKDFADTEQKLEMEIQDWLNKLKVEFLPEDDIIKKYGLVDLWNEREKELHPKNPRLIDVNS